MNEILKGRSVLIVDDEPHMIMMLEKRLASWGCLIRKASNGQEAIESVRSQVPDLILLDAMMPRLGGLEAFQELKKLDEAARIPVIFVTANVKPDLQKQIMAEGAFACVHKPFDTNELKQIMESALKS